MAQTAHEKANAIVQDLKNKLTEAQAQREDEAEMLDNGAESREELNAAKSGLEKEVKEFEKQLAAYSDSDPTELEHKREEMKKFKGEADQWTDDIYAMESKLKEKFGEESVKELRAGLYGDEYDEEEGGLKDI